MCVIYVDDAIFSGPHAKLIEKEIESLEISNNEKQHTFELKNAGEVNDFLGIRIEKIGNDKLLEHQTFDLQQRSKILFIENYRRS